MFNSMKYKIYVNDEKRQEIVRNNQELTEGLVIILP